MPRKKKRKLYSVEITKPNGDFHAMFQTHNPQSSMRDGILWFVSIDHEDDTEIHLYSPTDGWRIHISEVVGQAKKPAVSK